MMMMMMMMMMIKMMMTMIVKKSFRSLFSPQFLVSSDDDSVANDVGEDYHDSGEIVFNYPVLLCQIGLFSKRAEAGLKNVVAYIKE